MEKSLYAFKNMQFTPDIDQLEVLGTQIQWSDSGSAEAGIVLLAPGTDGPPIHFHPSQEEEFYIQYGELTVHMNGHWKTLKTGDTFTIPKGASHTYKNASGQNVLFNFCLTPQVRFRKMMELMDHYVQRGQIKGTDFKSLLYMCRVMAAFPDVTRSVKPPQFIVHAMAAVCRIFFK